MLRVLAVLLISFTWYAYKVAVDRLLYLMALFDALRGLFNAKVNLEEKQ